MSYMYCSKPEILRFQPIPPFIFPLQSLLTDPNVKDIVVFLALEVFHFVYFLPYFCNTKSAIQFYRANSNDGVNSVLDRTKRLTFKGTIVNRTLHSMNDGSLEWHFQCYLNEPFIYRVVCPIPIDLNSSEQK